MMGMPASAHSFQDGFLAKTMFLDQELVVSVPACHRLRVAEESAHVAIDEVVALLHG